MRTRRSLSWLLALVVGLFAVHALAETAAPGEPVEGKGEAAIVNGDLPTAKEKARKAALRDAVERTLGTFVVSDTQTKDFQLVKDQVLSSASGYVSSYDVVDEKEEGGAWVVRVKARVAQGKISEDAQARGLVLRTMKYPRVAVLIAEQHIGQAQPGAWWGPQGGGQQAGGVITVDQRVSENQLISEWQKDGFSFVDMDALAGKLRSNQSAVSLNPSANEVRELKNLLDADVIIVGTAIATKQGDLGKFLNDSKGEVSMTSCKGSLSVRAFNSDSGEILTTSDQSYTNLHVDPLVCDRRAVIGATHAVAADLQKKLLEAWNKRITSGSRVRMSVKGIDSLRTLNDFKRALSAEVRGVQEISQKGFGDGKADLDVRLDGGDTEGLAGDLDGRQLGKLKVKVTGMTANTIAVELAR